MTGSATTLRRRVRLPQWVHGLGAGGVPEALTGLALMTYNEAFPLKHPDVRGWPDFLIDFSLWLCAGLVGRYPRIGTFGVGLLLVAYAALPGWPSWSLFAFLVPIVSLGAHGRTQLRDVATVWYLVMAFIITRPRDLNASESLQNLTLWLVIVGVAWLTGRTIHRLRMENVKQVELRSESLRSQRRSIARDLHDTVAYATTTMIMRAEEIKLRSTDPALTEDLDFIISTGRRSVRDLRGMMETLRRNDPGLEIDADGNSPWRLVTVGDVITERRAELAAHGLDLHVSAPDDLDSLPSSLREALGKLIVEATSNMVKHAGRGPCQLIIERHDDTVEAVFTNPVKPLPERLVHNGDGLGIIGATERVHALGGELEATQASGAWILRAQLPVGQ